MKNSILFPITQLNIHDVMSGYRHKKCAAYQLGALTIGIKQFKDHSLNDK